MNYKQMIWESHHYRFGLAGEGQADDIQGVLDRAPGLVLNVGCAYDGSKVARLAASCTFQFALDKVYRGVLKATKTCTAGNVAFLAGDAHSLPLKDECIEHVVALGLFAYVVDPLAVFREFHRVTKPGGHVMITNSVSRSKDLHRQAGIDVRLTPVNESEGHCPAASGDIKRRYLLVFSQH